MPAHSLSLQVLVVCVCIYVNVHSILACHVCPCIQVLTADVCMVGVDGGGGEGGERKRE